MPTFVKSGFKTPFGRNQFLRSTKDVKTDSFTCASGAVPAETIDGTTQKILQHGEAMAKITSGADSGKVGPFQAAVTDGRQTLANLIGLNNTFLPWQLLVRDVEVAVVYEATVVQGWCFERNAAGARIALTTPTAAAMQNQVTMDIRFR